MEPSTTPTEPSWYEVAKLALAREERVSRRPRGVWKSSRAGRRCQRMGTRESKEVFWAAEGVRTVGRGIERGVRVVAAPACRLVECAVDIVHELAHFSAQCTCSR